MAETPSILSVEAFQKWNQRFDISSISWDFGWATATKNSAILYDYLHIGAPGFITYRRWACFNSPEELLGALYHVWLPDMLNFNVMGETGNRFPIGEVLTLTQPLLDDAEFEKLSQNVEALEQLAARELVTYEAVSTLLEQLQADLTSVPKETTHLRVFTNLNSAMQEFFEEFDVSRFDQESMSWIDYEPQIREALEKFDQDEGSRQFISSFLNDSEPEFS